MSLTAYSKNALKHITQSYMMSRYVLTADSSKPIPTGFVYCDSRTPVKYEADIVYENIFKGGRTTS